MKLPALNDISFEVDKGDFVVLSGASGAGKTTLLRLLYADERVSDGEIEVAGHRVAYRRKGDGPALVLLHGWPANSREWRRQIDVRLSRGARGHGPRPD